MGLGVGRVPGPAPGNSGLQTAATRSGVLLGVYERRLRGLITLTELRGLDPKGFVFWRWALGVGSLGRWVLGVGLRTDQLLGVGYVGCSRAATTRSPDVILCEGPSYVVLKHASRWRRDP